MLSKSDITTSTIAKIHRKVLCLHTGRGIYRHRGLFMLGVHNMDSMHTHINPHTSSYTYGPHKGPFLALGVVVTISKTLEPPRKCGHLNEQPPLCESCMCVSGVLWAVVWSRRMRTLWTTRDSLLCSAFYDVAGYGFNGSVRRRGTRRATRSKNAPNTKAARHQNLIAPNISSPTTHTHTIYT